MWSELKYIYSKLQDEESKFIFRKRLEYSLCNKNIESIFEMATQKEDNGEHSLYTLLKSRSNCSKEQPIILFGAGYWGQIHKPFIEEYKVGVLVAYCDNNKELQGTKCRDLPVWSVEEACELEPAALFILESEKHGKEMKEQLMSLGIEEEHIFGWMPTSSIYGVQYFDKNIIRACSEDEVFIDGGSLNLMDTCHFVDNYPKFKKIYAFEPDISSYAKCKKIKEELLDNSDRIELVNKGLWSREGKLSFEGGRKGASFVSEFGDEVVDVISIDSFIERKEETVTLIKMDIEGAELEALKGAKETILRDKPDLAICIYHKDEDIIEIPKYILELNPDYELYIRHYYWTKWETVLYAVNTRMKPYELSDLKWKILTKILDEPERVIEKVSGIDNLVIYGMGNLTMALVKEMKVRDVSPLCIVDAYKESGCYEGVPVYNIKEVQGLGNKEISIIITPVNHIADVRKKLNEYYIQGKLIPIWEVIGDDEIADRLRYINRL